MDVLHNLKSPVQDLASKDPEACRREDKHSQPLPYQYRPLPRGWIRIIEIENSTHDADPIHCRMTHIQLDGWDYHQTYTTLSYVWGRTSADGSHLSAHVKCDGAIIRITSNLHEGLKHFRAHKAKLNLIYPLWVDAICINQDDPIERSRQVELMPTIYSVSHLLLIWLGKECLIKRDEPLTLELLDTLVGYSWFRRRWTVQEYHSTPPDRRFFLIDGMLLWADTIQSRLRLHGMLHKAGPMTKAGSVEQPSAPWLIQNLVAYADAQCSDTNDIVYALRSISADGDALAVDYTRPVEETFSDVANLCIDDPVKAIMLLASATAWRHHDGLTPTWIPNWRVPADYSSPEHQTAVERILAWKYNALESRHPELTRAKGSLQIKAHCLSPCFPPRHQDPETNNGCPCCKICGAWWSGWSPQLMALLEHADRNDSLLLLARYGASAWAVYVLFSGPKPNTYRMHFCLLVGDFTPGKAQEDEIREKWFGWAGKCRRLAREMESTGQYLRTLTIA